MKSLNLEKILNHGLELSRSTRYFPVSSRLLITGRLGGLQEGFLDLKDLIIARQERLLVSEELLVTHIIEHVFMLDFELLAQTEK